MAIVFDAPSSAQNSSASSLTFSHTCTGSDRLLFVGASAGHASGTSTVTYNAVSMTAESWDINTGGDQNNSGHYLVAPATTANNIVISFGGTAASIGGGISFTGVDQSTPVGTANTAIGADGTATVDITSATNEVVVDNVNWENNGAGDITVGADQTSRFDESIAETLGAAGSTEAGAATVTMSWTATADDWLIGGLPLKPAAEAGAADHIVISGDSFTQFTTPVTV